MSDYQIEDVIILQILPPAYKSCKLTVAQENDHVMGNKVLSIILVIEEFHSMFLGTESFIYILQKIQHLLNSTSITASTGKK